MHHLAAAGGMADMNRILQLEMIRDGFEIVGVMVHVMSVTGLSRATMSAPISGNDPIAFTEEKKHLRVPIIRRQSPAVTEDNRLSAAPVFVIDVDVSSVFFSNCHVWHERFLSLLVFLSCGRPQLNNRHSRLSISRFQRYISVTSLAGATPASADAAAASREAIGQPRRAQSGG